MTHSKIHVWLPLLAVCWFCVQPAYSQNRDPAAQNPRSRAPGSPNVGGRQPAGPQRQIGPRVGGRQPAGPQVADRRLPGPPPSAIVRPFPPLPAKHQEYLDQVLKFWEYKSNKVKHYHCEFRRWKYDPTFGPVDKPLEINEGMIKFEDPDKGLYRVDKTWVYRAPRVDPDKEEPKSSYAESKAPGEHWVCDGKSVFEFDYNNKRLIERELPPNVQGTRIVEGPLPFLFGAKVDTLKQRFWMRIITPADVKGEYWIEAFPKGRQDKASFQKVHIIIAESDYLPQGLVLFSPDFRPDKPARTSYTFTKRQVNPINLNLPMFRRDFFNPKAPDKDWKTVKESYAGPAALPQRAPSDRPSTGPPAARQTQRTGGFPQRR